MQTASGQKTPLLVIKEESLLLMNLIDYTS